MVASFICVSGNSMKWGDWCEHKLLQNSLVLGIFFFFIFVFFQMQADFFLDLALPLYLVLSYSAASASLHLPCFRLSECKTTYNASLGRCLFIFFFFIFFLIASRLLCISYLLFVITLHLDGTHHIIRWNTQKFTWYTYNSKKITNRLRNEMKNTHTHKYT